MAYLVIKESLLMIHIHFLIYEILIQIDLSVRNEVFHGHIHDHIRGNARGQIRGHASGHVRRGQILPRSDAHHVHDDRRSLYDYGDFQESRWSLTVLPPTEQQSCEISNVIREILTKKQT